ncbi:MAG: hypothetical protein ACI9FU_001909 [Granulosicoccus sp.]|jgi:hypothetical protein
MSRIVFISFLLFNLWTSALSQVQFNIAFELPSYEYVHGVVQDINGDYIVSGTSGSLQDQTNAQAFLFRVDSLGGWKWMKYYGTDQVDNGQNLALMDNGDLGICGYSDGNRPNDYDIFLIRTNNNGDELWMKFYGGDSWDIANQVKKTSDDGFIVAGKTFSFGNGGSDAYLIRTDSDGDTLWTRTFGGPDDDEFHSVVPTMDGGFVAIGYTETNTYGMKDAYLVKVDQNGNHLWDKHFGGFRDDIGHSIDETAIGDLIWTGEDHSDPGSNGNSDMAVYRLTADGDSIHSSVQTNYGGGMFDEIPYVIHPTTDNGYITAGFTQGFWVDMNDFMLMRTNDNCQFSWAKIYSCIAFTEEVVGDMIVAADGGFLVANSTTHGNGPSNIQLVKTDSNADGISVDCVTGVEDIESGNMVFSYYPNPTQDFLNITLQSTENKGEQGMIRVIDSAGRQVLSDRSLKQNQVNSIDLDGLKSGLYYLHISIGGETAGRAFVKN